MYPLSWERIARVGEAASARAAQAAGVGAARALEPLAAALQAELASKLTATDILLRENIDKLANSKVLTATLIYLFSFTLHASHTGS